MGFTPLEGLVMATRSGSLDPGLLLWAQRSLGRDPATTERELDREAGLLALCGHADMREAIAAAEAGEERSRLALDVYVHRLAGAVAAMAAAAGGLDALVFTGGVGEHAASVRAAACERLGFLGVSFDPALNAGSGDRLLGAGGVPAIVVAAREDIEIARQTRQALGLT
jgi:acetate kinase